MKIGYFVTEFPFTDPISGEITYLDGGVGAVALNLARKMVERGHEVTVFTSAYGNGQLVERHEGMEIIRYPPDFYVGQAPMALSLLYHPLRSVRDLEIIHTHMGNLPAPIGAERYARRMGVPLVTTYHGEAVGGFGSIPRRIGVFLSGGIFCRRILSASDRVIVLSAKQLAYSHSLREFGKKIEIVPNGVDIREFELPISREEARIELGLPLGAHIVLFLGNLAPIKGPQVLLEAMQYVLGEEPEAHAIFVGTGPCLEPLAARADRIGISGSISFTGAAYGRKKSLLYRAADIFVLPSLSESFSLVLLEASASGLPQVVSKIEPLRELVCEGYNGLFTTPRNAMELAVQILSLIKDDCSRKRMGENAKKHLVHNLKKFTWEQIAERTEQIYSNII